jgi:hypothetical protein
MVKFKLIMVFVDDAKTDLVLDAARTAGATGATIIKYAQGQGLERRATFFGLEYLSPRDVVLVLVEARRSAEVLEAIASAAGLDESLDTGLALELDVDRVLGLSAHIEALAAVKPID